MPTQKNGVEREILAAEEGKQEAKGGKLGVETLKHAVQGAIKEAEGIKQRREGK